jgi:hypothetical protein
MCADGACHLPDEQIDQPEEDDPEQRKDDVGH